MPGRIQKMKILLLTVAGRSERFSKSLGKPCLKCIYYQSSIKETLLYQMLQRHAFFDKIVIVGGFQFDELYTFIQIHFTAIAKKLLLIKNEHYYDYGSYYSFYLGCKAIKDIYWDELIFAEGDLYVDDQSFASVCNSSKNVMSYNFEPVDANKAVAFYFDLDKKVHYIYDTAHGALQIPVPFISIYNSAQIWKFLDPILLKKIINSLDQQAYIGTNLIPINHYFQNVSPAKTELIGFHKWINCNTIEDFQIKIGENQ